MMRHLEHSELAALVTLLLVVIGLPAAILGYQFGLRPALAQARTIDIIAAAPEAGGFQPDSIRVSAGETVRLRFSVPDVTHGLAIGPGLGLDFGQLDPGEVKEVEVTFAEAGRYTLYCNTWCSPSHWRMRSTIEVLDPANPNAPPPSGGPDPVLESLTQREVDIDAPHPVTVIPTSSPNAEQGHAVVAQLDESLPPELLDLNWRRSHSPVEAQQRLVRQGLSEAEAWDAVAYLWLLGLTLEDRRVAADLYAKNCAACHGESGDGRGPGAAMLAAQHTDHTGAMGMATAPTAFVDFDPMLGGAGDIYYAKLRRGGMGTSMPSFGQLFTPQETWQLVDYLWTFVFEPADRMDNDR
jgi:plastocyanin/mono/diheme cytochrome c family protein